MSGRINCVDEADRLAGNKSLSPKWRGADLRHFDFDQELNDLIQTLDKKREYNNMKLYY